MSKGWNWNHLSLMCREILRVQNLSACSWFLSLTALWLRHPQKIGLLNYVCLLQLGSKKLGSIERGETNCSAWLIVQHDDIMLQDFKKIFGFFCAMLLSWVPPFSWLIFCAGPDKKTHSFEFLNFLSLNWKQHLNLMHWSKCKKGSSGCWDWSHTGVEFTNACQHDTTFQRGR